MTNPNTYTPPNNTTDPILLLHERLTRMETKIDDIGKALIKLATIEERMANMTQNYTKLVEDHAGLRIALEKQKSEHKTEIDKMWGHIAKLKSSLDKKSAVWDFVFNWTGKIGTIVAIAICMWLGSHPEEAASIFRLVGQVLVGG